MGFLDHSTNNIIVDAVLTDTGRATLAKNDGSFVISKFAFGDDEIDYSTIRKFGTTVGKEKISKNTPIFEAQTNGDLALKYRLLSVSVPDLIVLPLIQITHIQDGSVFARSEGLTQKHVTIEQTIAAGIIAVPTDLVDSAFVVQWDNRFLNIQRQTSGGMTTKTVSNNVASVTVAASNQSSSGQGGLVDIDISLNGFGDDYYDTYSTGGSNPEIKTQVTISGRASGASVTQEFTIKK